MRPMSRDEDPRVSLLPAELRARHEQHPLFLPRSLGAEWLDARKLKLTEIDAVLDALGGRAGDLRGLSFHGRNLGKPGFTKIAAWPGLAHFTHLSIAHMPKLGAPELRKVLASKYIAQLEHLDVRGPSAKDPYPILAAANLPQLSSLSLGPSERNRPGPNAMPTLTGSALQLRRLELDGFPIGAFEQLGESRLGRGLQELVVVGQRRQEVGTFLGLVADANRLQQLTLTRQRHDYAAKDWGERAPESLCALHIEGALPSVFGPLATAPFVAQLERLELERCRLDLRAIEPLLARTAPSLTRLSLHDCVGMSDAIFDALVDSPFAANLVRLDLAGTGLGSDVIQRAPEPIADAMRAAGWPA